MKDVHLSSSQAREARVAIVHYMRNLADAIEAGHYDPVEFETDIREVDLDSDTPYTAMLRVKYESRTVKFD